MLSCFILWERFHFQSWSAHLWDPQELELYEEWEYHSMTFLQMVLRLYCSLSETATHLKYFSLVTLMLQNAVFILMMRYVRTRPGDMFMSTTAVIMSEVLKFLACFIIIFYKEGSVRAFLSHLNENIIQQPMDCLKISVPSIIYTVQNNLLFVAVSNLDAAVFQVSVD